MNKLTTSTAIPTRALKLEALSTISASFEAYAADDHSLGLFPSTRKAAAAITRRACGSAKRSPKTSPTRPHDCRHVLRRLFERARLEAGRSCRGDCASRPVKQSLAPIPNADA
jgi:hypothetical protein